MRAEWRDDPTTLKKRKVMNHIHRKSHVNANGIGEGRYGNMNVGIGFSAVIADWSESLLSLRSQDSCRKPQNNFRQQKIPRQRIRDAFSFQKKSHWMTGIMLLLLCFSPTSLNITRHLLPSPQKNSCCQATFSSSLF